MQHYHNKPMTTHFNCHYIASMYAGISRIRNQVWLLHISADEFLHYSN